MEGPQGSHLIDPDLAVAIVQHAMSPGPGALRVDPRGGQTIVSADADGAAWAVLPFDGPPDLMERAELYHVMRYASVVTGRRPRGVARIRDEALLLLLEDRGEFRELWGRIGSALSTETLAWLLSFYQPGAPRSAPHQHLIRGPEDLPRFLSQEDVVARGGSPRVSTDREEGGRAKIEFSTYARGGPEHRPEITLHRWRVEAGPGSDDLRWASTVLAEDLTPSAG